MRTRRPRRLLAPAALLTAAAALLTGCRIPSTGVVQAGEPATGLNATLLVYFVRDGALFPSERPVDGAVGVEAALMMLLKGPTRDERGTLLTTELPPPADGARPVRATTGTVEIDLPYAKPISDLALDQLACTAVAAQALESPATAKAPLRLTVTTPVDRITITADTKRCPMSPPVWEEQPRDPTRQ
ncbi:hypothetical protein ACFVT5_09410 [Streptomyces sp. NPDC058001]|uniref:hypothetical protein n=1 Tax=Streptomyces sp. NPDC058001 TaxID=3346300 RepID=UPI0036E86D07